jgi:drug/metabolite transporter (DMT)-like permease
VTATLAWATLGLLWGSTWLAIKVGLADVPPFTFAAARFLIAALPLLVILRLRRIRLPRQTADWALMAVSGVLTIGLSYGLVFWGERQITAGLTAILFATYPLFGQVFAHLLLRTEPISAPRLYGVVAGLGGVVLIFADQAGGTGDSAVAGGAAVVVAAACAAAGAVLVKGHGAHLDPMLVTTVQMICGWVPLSVAGVLAEGNPLAVRWTPLALGSLAYLALVGSSLCLVIWYWLVRTVPVTTAQLVPLANTVVAVLLGWLLLDEGLDARTVTGGAVVLAGLAVALLRPAAGARDSPPSAARRYQR